MGRLECGASVLLFFGRFVVAMVIHGDLKQQLSLLFGVVCLNFCLP